MTFKINVSSYFKENVGGTTYFYNAEDFTPQREGIVSELVLCNNEVL